MSTMGVPEFTVDIFQNGYLPVGGRQVNVIVTVTSARSTTDGPTSVADVALRVWTPQCAVVRFVKQVAPTVDDLTGRRTPSGPQSGDYPIGAWGPGESRDYHAGVEVIPFTPRAKKVLELSLREALACHAQVIGRMALARSMSSMRWLRSDVSRASAR
jgi:hypothetical protein